MENRLRCVMVKNSSSIVGKFSCFEMFMEFVAWSLRSMVVNKTSSIVGRLGASEMFKEFFGFVSQVNGFV